MTNCLPAQSGAIEVEKLAPFYARRDFRPNTSGRSLSPRATICHLSFVILLASCATQPTFRTVVLDPGHGGHDPGATRYGVSPEKVWTLDLAFRLKSRLEPGGFSVILTRQSDVFIPLEDRVLISNAQPNVIFVSLHFNSTPKRDIQGVETYTTPGAARNLPTKFSKTSCSCPACSIAGSRRRPTL
jgi:N-acetylmuramoyl-L-alanine amidase